MYSRLQIKNPNGWLNVLPLKMVLASLSGLLIFLSFPKYGRGIVAWAALIPLFWALQGVQSREGFKLGFLAGFAAHVGILYWIAYVVVQYGYLPLYVGIAAMLLLCAYLTLYTAFSLCALCLDTPRLCPLPSSDGLSVGTVGTLSVPFSWCNPACRH